MFCPKCGSQNADETKFCRGCGADLSNVLTVVDGKLPGTTALAEKHIELYTLGIRGLMLGIGFLFISGLVFAAFSPRAWFLGIFALVPAVIFLATGISRFIQSKGIKALAKRDEPAALPSGQVEYVKPLRSIYETDELSARPLSVTEHTTTHLQVDTDDETRSVPKKK